MQSVALSRVGGEMAHLVYRDRQCVCLCVCACERVCVTGKWWNGDAI